MSDSEKLRQIIRFEVDPAPFGEDTDENPFFDVDKYKGSYKPSYKDLVVACKNMLKISVDLNTLLNWYYFVSDDLAEHYEGAFSPVADFGHLWPNNDAEIFKAMDIALSELNLDDGFFETYDCIRDGLEEIIQMAEYYEYNREHDMSDWKFTRWQRHQIVWTFSEDTANVSKSRRELFKRIIDEECEKGNDLAMRIKGYGCYGGDKVFECDWEESRRLITKLFEKEGNPYYANTLGYIYYYGRCNNGIPEYEKAFQYFSVGAANDVIESMYKIADMFLSGKGCIKSPETSDHIIFKLYDECRPRFCMGDDAKFADIALRWAAHWQRIERYSEAFYHYLEAEYAIKKRLKKSDFFGDKKVQENIKKIIEEVKAHLEPGYLKDKDVTRKPYWLFDMIWDNSNVKFEITHIEGNRYKLKVTRPRKDHAPKALIVAPELERVTRTRTFESEFVTDEPVVYECKDKSNMYVNNIKYSDENEYDFCNGDVTIFKIKNADYILQRTDFDRK